MNPPAKEKPAQFGDKEIYEEILKLLDVLPLDIQKKLKESPDLPTLVEIVLDLGKPAEARFAKRSILIGGTVNQGDIDYVTTRIGQFSGDNRAGIERTLHRISAMRNRAGKVIGLTCRVGRAIYGTNDIIRRRDRVGPEHPLHGAAGDRQDDQVARSGAHPLRQVQQTGDRGRHSAMRSPATAISRTRGSARRAGCRSPRPNCSTR